MKYAIISDIHSNIQALEQVFKMVNSEVDQIICLGDIVGYNANPKECIKAVRKNSLVTHIVQGNHDEDTGHAEENYIGHIGELSPDAYAGIKYSSSVLSKKDKEWLKQLPESALIEDPDIPFLVSHYSPEICTAYGYILNDCDARISIKRLKKMGNIKLFFFGHSHLPTYIEDLDGRLHFDMGRHLENDIYVIDTDVYRLINPGSVGQPRGGGITSYAILDTKKKTVKIQGFQYDIEAAQKAVREAGYSKSIENRLDPDYEQKIKRAKKDKYKARQKYYDSIAKNKLNG
jgi:predicted phosphodiesterase